MSFFDIFFPRNEADERLKLLDQYMREHHGEAYGRYKEAPTHIRVAMTVDYLRSELEAAKTTIAVLRSKDKAQYAGARDYRSGGSIRPEPKVEAPNGRNINGDSPATIERSGPPPERKNASPKGSYGGTSDGSST